MRAEARTAYATASAGYEEAARLSPEASSRARRVFAAAQSAWLGAQAERAVALLSEARARAGASPLRVEIEALAGQIALEQGALEDGYRMVDSAASGLVAMDRVRAIHLLGRASLMGFGAGRLDNMLTTARRALELLQPGDPASAAIAAHTAVGCAAVLAAIGDEGPRHLRAAEERLRQSDLEADPLLALCAVSVGLFLREADAGRELLERAHSHARAQAPAAALPLVLFYLGRDLATTDRWSAARAHYEESLRLARDTAQHNWLAGALAGLSQLDALEGRAAELDQHAVEVEALADR